MSTKCPNSTNRRIRSTSTETQQHKLPIHSTALKTESSPRAQRLSSTNRRFTPPHHEPLKDYLGLVNYSGKFLPSISTHHTSCRGKTFHGNGAKEQETAFWWSRPQLHSRPTQPAMKFARVKIWTDCDPVLSQVRRFTLGGWS